MRSVPLQSPTAASTATSSPSTRSHSRIPFFFCAGAACNFISSPFQSRTPASPPPPASSDSYRKFVPYDSLLPSPSLPPPSPPPPPSPSKLSSTSRLGQRALSRKRIWKWVEAMVLTSFGFVLLLFCLPPGNRQCIFYNAAMSRWPGVARRPFSPALAVPGAPLNPATTQFPAGRSLDRSRTSHAI